MVVKCRYIVYDHDAAGYPTGIGIPDPRGRREWFCIKCGADALSDVEPTDHDCPGYRPPDDEPPHTETCPHCKGSKSLRLLQVIILAPNVEKIMDIMILIGRNILWVR